MRKTTEETRRAIEQAALSTFCKRGYGARCRALATVRRSGDRVDTAALSRDGQTNAG